MLLVYSYILELSCVNGLERRWAQAHLFQVSQIKCNCTRFTLWPMYLYEKLVVIFSTLSEKCSTLIIAMIIGNDADVFIHIQLRLLPVNWAFPQCHKRPSFCPHHAIDGCRCVLSIYHRFISIELIYNNGRFISWNDVYLLEWCIFAGMMYICWNDVYLLSPSTLNLNLASPKITKDLLDPLCTRHIL